MNSDSNVIYTIEQIPQAESSRVWTLHSDTVVPAHKMPIAGGNCILPGAQVAWVMVGYIL